MADPSLAAVDDAAEAASAETGEGETTVDPYGGSSSAETKESDASAHPLYSPRSWSDIVAGAHYVADVETVAGGCVASVTTVVTGLAPMAAARSGGKVSAHLALDIVVSEDGTPSDDALAASEAVEVAVYGTGTSVKNEGMCYSSALGTSP